MKAWRYALVLLVWACSGLIAQAATEAPPSPPEHLSALIPGSRLAGQGTLRWYGFRIYDAQLWVGPRGYIAQAPTDAPFALDLAYARAFQGKAIAKTTLEELERMGQGSADERRKWYEELERSFPDVKEGDHLTAVFLPDEGTRLYYNGQFVTRLGDVKFARAFFAIWLDSRTRAPNLREQLLAAAAPSS